MARLAVLRAKRQLEIDTTGRVKARSGGGGASCHYYFLCPQPMATKVLASGVAEDGGRWEIGFGGDGRQFVLPGSIHPDTGNRYERVGDADWRDLPLIDAAWAGRRAPAKTETSSGRIDLQTWFHRLPTDYTTRETEQILDRLPNRWVCDQRSLWQPPGDQGQRYEGNEALHRRRGWGERAARQPLDAGQLHTLQPQLGRPVL